MRRGESGEKDDTAVGFLSEFVWREGVERDCIPLAKSEGFSKNYNS